MANATNPTATSVLIDEETLDLSVPEPSPTEHLSLIRDEYMKAHYHKGCWALDPEQSLGIKLRLDEQDQLTLTYDLYSPEDPSIRYFYQSYYGQEGVWRRPLSFVFRADAGHVYLDLDCNPLAQTFFKVTTPLLPLAKQQVGDNFCTLYSNTKLKPLFVRAVTLKRFRVQRQLQTQWCWAAVTASLMSLLDPSNQTQSVVVSQTLGTDSVNRPSDITQAAKKLGLAVKYTSRQLALYELRDGISQGLPIPLQINWRKADGEWGAGHYVVLTGIGPDVEDEDQTLIKIEDPSKGELQMTFAELKNDYPGAANKHLYQNQVSGGWTWTHRIEKKPARKAKAEKYRAPKLATHAERETFSHQWEQARPAAEDKADRLAAVEKELAQLRQMAEDEINAPAIDVGGGLQVVSWTEAREQRLRLVYEQQLRLLWVRAAFGPITLLCSAPIPDMAEVAKPPSFFDKK